MSESEFEKWLKELPRGEPELRKAFVEGAYQARWWILSRLRNAAKYHSDLDKETNFKSVWVNDIEEVCR